MCFEMCHCLSQPGIPGGISFKRRDGPAVSAAAAAAAAAVEDVRLEAEGFTIQCARGTVHGYGRSTVSVNFRPTAAGELSTRVPHDLVAKSLCVFTSGMGCVTNLTDHHHCNFGHYTLFFITAGLVPPELGSAPVWSVHLRFFVIVCDSVGMHHMP